MKTPPVHNDSVLIQNTICRRVWSTKDEKSRLVMDDQNPNDRRLIADHQIELWSESGRQALSSAKTSSAVDAAVTVKLWREWRDQK